MCVAERPDLAAPPHLSVLQVYRRNLLHASKIAVWHVVLWSNTLCNCSHELSHVQRIWCKKYDESGRCFPNFIDAELMKSDCLCVCEELECHLSMHFNYCNPRSKWQQFTWQQCHLNSITVWTGSLSQGADRLQPTFTEPPSFTFKISHEDR